MASMNEAQKHEALPRDQFLKNIEGAIVENIQEMLAAQSSKPKIQRVPFMLRDHKHFVKYYEPRAIALGPLHHSKENCKLAEKFKPALAARFIEDSGNQADYLLKIIEDEIKTLRDCYNEDEESTEPFSDEALAQLLFLDGCSTLQFIYSLMHGELASFKIKRDQVAFAQQDLFLLENQLPYQVLKLLMSSSKKHAELKIAIEEFVKGKIMATEKKKSTGHTLQPGDASIYMGNIEEPEPTHLLELLRTEMLGCQESNAIEKIVKIHGQSFRSIQELKAAGIHFRPSRKSTLRDISFTSLGFAGLLRLPPISVDDNMGLQFMNLIAYEMCPDFQNDFGVSSYIGFLDSLIEHADDVKQLRKAGVLHNLLGSDEEVAQLFNEIGTDLVTNSDAYVTVKAKIEKHFKSKCKTWLGYICHEHFSNASPWTLLTFILGVLVALVLSGIQTWYTVNPPCDSAC